MGISKQESKDNMEPAMQFCSREWTIREKFVAFYIFIVHILCIFAPSQFTWNAFWVAIALYVITGLFGISISYHRNLSHRSFNLPKWLEYLFAYCGVHAFQVWYFRFYFLKSHNIFTLLEIFLFIFTSFEL